MDLSAALKTSKKLERGPGRLGRHSIRGLVNPCSLISQPTRLAEGPSEDLIGQRLLASFSAMFSASTFMFFSEKQRRA